MKGFSISGPNGPIFSVCHAHGALFSAVAENAKLTLPATDKCPTCGYRKVEKAKLTTFFHEIGKALVSNRAKFLRLDGPRLVRAGDTVLECLQALDETPADKVELIDDYVWCEKHAYQ